jgi:hypothetical protein
MNSTSPRAPGTPIRGVYVAYAPDMSLSIGPPSRVTGILVLEDADTADVDLFQDVVPENPLRR